jgi:TctA family transporter
MIISRGDPTVFITRPISAGLVITAVLVLIVVLMPGVAKKRDEVFIDEA